MSIRKKEITWWMIRRNAVDDVQDNDDQWSAILSMPSTYVMSPLPGGLLLSVKSLHMKTEQPIYTYWRDHAKMHL